MEQEEIEDKLEKIDKWPLDLKSYNEFKGEEYDFLDTKRPEKLIQYETTHHQVNHELIGELFEKGMCALVGCRSSYFKDPGGGVDYFEWGVPVRKKIDEEQM